jgi:exosortase/archaeosortase family protein
MAIICAANVARIAALTMLQRYWPEAFDVVHSLGASAIFYLVVFVLWMLWAHYGAGSLPAAGYAAGVGARPAAQG